MSQNIFHMLFIQVFFSDAGYASVEEMKGFHSTLQSKDSPCWFMFAWTMLNFWQRFVRVRWSKLPCCPSRMQAILRLFWTYCIVGSIRLSWTVTCPCYFHIQIVFFESNHFLVDVKEEWNLFTSSFVENLPRSFFLCVNYCQQSTFIWLCYVPSKSTLIYATLIIFVIIIINI